MSEDGTWGDQLVLVALANALEKTIRVVTSTTDKESIEVFVESENQQAEGAPLLLGNLTENHYLSLEPIENIFKGICPFTFYDQTIKSRVTKCIKAYSARRSLIVIHKFLLIT